MKFDALKRLCIEGYEFIRSPQFPDGLVPKGTYDSLKQRSRIEVLERGGNGRSVLIVYESLPPAYKQLVIEKYGDPYTYLARQSLLSLISRDIKAEKFFLDYRYDQDKCLPAAYIDKYVNVASWLNMLIKVKSDKNYLKKQLYISMEDFWKIVPELILLHRLPLPNSCRRLCSKIQAYQAKGYKTLIDWRFGNSNSKKIKAGLCEAVLLELIALPNQHDDTIIATTYNQWAQEHQHATITPATVGNYRRRQYYQLQLFREGNAAWYNKFGKQTKRLRPSAPLLLVGSDDNDLDLYFRHEKLNRHTHLTTHYYHRFKTVIISDAYNDYPLGYCYADNISTDLVKMAYLDAMHHIHFLTGGWYLPHQLQTDRWNYKALRPFYQQIDPGYFAAAARSPRSKYIERSFGHRWHQHLRKFSNYAGNNITSKFRLNPEHLEKSKYEFPHKEDALFCLETFIENLRQEKNPKTGYTRQENWKTAFFNSETAAQRAISREQLLLTFGVRHLFSNTLTNGGLSLKIQGTTYEYEVPDDLYLQHVGAKVQVTYDPYDFGSVLVTNDAQLRFVAYRYQKLPAARADFKEGDKERLFTHLHNKKALVQQITNNKKDRESLLAQHQLNAASMLQAQVMDKSLRPTAEKILLTDTDIANTIFDPLDLM